MTRNRKVTTIFFLALGDTGNDPASEVWRTAHILAQVAGTQDITYSVFLGVVERLPWGSGAWRATVIRRHKDAIERTIVEAANVGVQQAFRAFSAIGRYLSTEEPEHFLRIFRQLPDPTLTSIQADVDRFAWAEIFFEASRLPGADIARLQSRALELYEGEWNPGHFTCSVVQNC